MKAEIKAELALKILDPKHIPHLCKEGEIGAVVEWLVRDKNGKVTAAGQKRSESFVRQFLECLMIMWGPILEVPSYPVLDTGGISRTLCHTKGFMDTTGGAGLLNKGIIVGTDNTAPKISDYALNLPIGHGVGAGQLQYSIVTYGAPAADSVTSQFTITRNFANGSGNPITVVEVGLYVVCPKNYNVGTTHMLIRDVIPGGIVVPNGQTLTINYRPQAVL